MYFQVVPLNFSLIQYDIRSNSWSEIVFYDEPLTTNMKNCNCQNLLETTSETIDWLREHGAKT